MRPDHEKRRDIYKWPFGGRFGTEDDWVMRGHELTKSIWGLFVEQAVLNPDTLRGISDYRFFVHHPDIHPLVYVKPEVLTHLSVEPIVFVAWMAPSGSGKNTITDRALAQTPYLFSKILTDTTRNPRLDLADAISYNFRTDEQFMQMIDTGQFAEHVMQYGNRYGTTYHSIDVSVEGGNSLVLWQGEPIGWNNLKFELARKYGTRMRLLSIFTTPEVTLGTLRQRIYDKRSSEDPMKRYQKALLEIIAGGYADIWIRNPIEPKGPTQATQAFINVLEKIRETQGSPEANFDPQEIFTLA